MPTSAFSFEFRRSRFTCAYVRGSSNVGIKCADKRQQEWARDTSRTLAPSSCCCIVLIAFDFDCQYYYEDLSFRSFFAPHGRHGSGIYFFFATTCSCILCGVISIHATTIQSLLEHTISFACQCAQAFGSTKSIAGSSGHFHF